MGRRGWAIYTDFDSAAEAEDGCGKVAEELTRNGYREAEWVPEPAIEEFISQLDAGTV
jgi:hypothetical protein